MPRLYESSSRPLDNKSRRILSGEFAEFDTKNQNDRIYPRRVYESALQELMPKIREGRLLGECDHPEYDEVRLANVSHVIRECNIKGNKLYGTVELLDTPSGKLAQALVEAGIPLGISSRGVGNTRRIKEGTEVTDLKLITFDLVADPSFSTAILTESKKATLNSRLSSIERTLPLNESSGENQAIRNKIQDIRESLKKSPQVPEELVESIGSLTIRNLELANQLSEATSRNKSLSSNMDRLQEGYNKLSEEVQGLLEKVSSMKSSYESKLVESEDKLVELRKELAIEKRGLSVEVTMPLLEGLTSTEEIDSKLNSLKHLGVRRHGSSIEIETLTEGLKSNKGGTRLSSIISQV